MSFEVSRDRPADQARHLAIPSDRPAGTGVRTKVMFVGPYPPPYSGPELGMKQFLDSDLSRDFDLRFIKTNFRASNVDKAKIGIASAFWTVVFHLRLIWNLIVFRPRAVYYPITPTAAGWIGRDAPCLLICHLLGTKTIIHLRGGHLRLNFQKFGPFVQWLVRWSCSTVSLALVQAECLCDQFDGLVASERIRVLPQAIDCAEYDAVSEITVNESIILFLGNLSYAKGYCDLLRALPRVAHAVPSVKLICCGSLVEGPTGVYFDQISGRKLEHESPGRAHQEFIRSPYAKHYEWRGVVSGSEKLQLLRSASLVTLPSYSEGFSRALMEAMATGRPVVCTPVGAHREFIIHAVNGLLVAPGDITALADALISLLSDESLRARIGTANRRYTREKFDIKIIAKQLAAFLLEATHVGDNIGR